MLEGGEPTITIPWPWLAAGITAIIAALSGVARVLYKAIIDNHNREIAFRDERRKEDSAAWKEAISTVASSNERAMAQLGMTLSQHIKESTTQQNKVIEALSRQLKTTERNK